MFSNIKSTERKGSFANKILALYKQSE